MKKIKEPGNPYLDLGSCDLEHELPEELLACIWLEGLNLGNREWDEEKCKYVGSENEGEENVFRVRNWLL